MPAAAMNEMTEALNQQRAMIETLRIQIAENDNRNAQLVQQVAELSAVASRREGRAARPAAIMTAKVLKPPDFAGALHERADVWTFQMDSYLRTCGTPVDQWVGIACHYLRGSAATWWRAEVGRRTGQAEALAQLYTWETFRTGLLSSFQRPDHVRAARDELAALVQKRSVAEYVAKIRDLGLQIPDMTEAELMDRFMRGLKHNIRQEVEMRCPEDLPRAIQMAERADAIQYRLHGAKLRHAGQGRPFQTGQMPRLRSETTAAEAVPMELGSVGPNTRRPDNTSTGPSRNQANRDSSHVKCYGCGQYGHIKKNCPARRQAFARRQ